MGCHVEGVALPHPCPHDPRTTEAGVRMRFACRPPKSDPLLMSKLRTFVRKWIRDHLKPVPADSDTSVPTWLDGTNYSLKRKEELLEKWKHFTKIDDPRQKYRRCKSFMKDETYVKYKHARGINSRSDEFKCFMGPIFKLIEAQLYKDHHFIKHVPVADRPRVILDRLFKIGAIYMATDYTAFESLFTKEVMGAVEFELYSFMTSELPEHQAFMRECWETLGGENVCTFKNFVVRLLATRMSGEMCTSLGNGFSNLMFMLFLCEYVGCTEIDGFIEGDDGIFSMLGQPPTSDDFARLGLNIKIELHDRLSTASFCGIVFDEGDCVNVTDPREVLASFGWTTSNYRGASKKKMLTLLRCKGLSYAHQYPGCPVIGALAHYALRISRSYDIRGVLEKNRRLSLWEREQLVAALKDSAKLKYVEPPMATRLLIEELYNLPVELQVSIETYLQSLDDLVPLDIAVLADICPREWSHYFENYSVVARAKDRQLEYPADVWPELAEWVREW